VSQALGTTTRLRGGNYNRSIPPTLGLRPPAMEPNLEPIGDAALYDRARSGDRVAIATLLERHVPRLRAYLRLKAGPLVRRRERTSDLVQSVCLELLGNIEQFEYRGEAAFRHWLYTAALRKVIAKDAYWRAQKREAGRDHVDGGQSEADVLLLAEYRRLSTPSQNALARDELERIESAFEHLSEEHREVILLARVAGLDRTQIGAAMGRSEGAIRVLLHRALARLASLLDLADQGGLASDGA